MCTTRMNSTLAIETVGSIDIPHSDIVLRELLEHTLLFSFCNTELVVRLGAPLDRCRNKSIQTHISEGRHQISRVELPYKPPPRITF